MPELRIDLPAEKVARLLVHLAAKVRPLLARRVEKAARQVVPVAVVVQVAVRRHHVPRVETKSAIAAHQKLTMEAAAADTAAAAVEITHGPAALVAAGVWVAVATAGVAVEDAAWAVAVVAVVAVEAAEVAGAAEDADVKQFDEEQTMKRKLTIMTSSKLFTIVSATLTCVGLILVADAAEKKQTSAAGSPPATQGQPKQFDTPDQAADALIQAAANADAAAAKDVLGPDSEDLISSEDPVMDKKRAQEFADKAKEKKSIETDKADPNRAILVVGNDDFPLPIPIVKNKGKWTFDTKVGREEILNRRVGANELNAIELCRGYVEAQHEYAADKHDDSKVNQYAQRILSSPGKHDGLAWQNADGTWGGPVGEEVAKALQEGYEAKPGPYHGYIFKVLKGQGKDAPMGEMDFVIGGAMIGGFALAAAPAEYRVTGVETFMVGPDGIVYQKDLGKDTLKTFQAMEKYNPDKTWQETDDDEEDDSD